MEDPDETGERTYTSKWNGGTYDPGTGRIGKHGGQDAENGASCNKAAVYIYIYIYMCVCVCVCVCVRTYARTYECVHMHSMCRPYVPIKRLRNSDNSEYL